MTTTKAGKNMGKQLSRAQNGEDFNKPTGKIYNETQLLKRLKVSYDTEAVLRLSIKSTAAISTPRGKTNSAADKSKDSADKAAEPDRLQSAEPTKPTEALPNDPFEKQIAR